MVFNQGFQVNLLLPQFSKYFFNVKRVKKLYVTSIEAIQTLLTKNLILVYAQKQKLLISAVAMYC